MSKHVCLALRVAVSLSRWTRRKCTWTCAL